MTSSRTLLDEVPVEATHSCLNLFEPSQLLVNYARGYDAEIFTHTSPDEPAIEFEISGAKNQMNGSVIDPKSITLQLKVECKRRVPPQPTDDASAKVTMCFVNNILHSLFSNVELFLQGVQVSSANNLYPHKAQIETETSHPPDCKNGILVIQGYEYEEDPADFGEGIAFQNRRTLLANQKGVLHLLGSPAIDFLGTDKFILPDVEMRIKFTRSSNAFVTLVVGDKDVAFDFKIVQASLHVHKLELNTPTFLSLEKALLKKPAKYPYTEAIVKSFVVPTGYTQFRKEDIFQREPISRLLFGMNNEADFTGNEKTNPFHYQKFNLHKFTFEREGARVGGTPVTVSQTDNFSYRTTQFALGLEHCGNGIPPEEFKHHYINVIRLTADIRTNDDTLRPELTGGRLTAFLEFSKPLVAPIRVFFYGERKSSIFINSSREVLKNSKFYYG